MQFPPARLRYLIWTTALHLQVVVVLDPDIAKEYLDKVQGRSKEKQYAFDMAFDYTNSNEVSPRSRRLIERRKGSEARN
jgi:hypothetical protein